MINHYKLLWDTDILLFQAAASCQVDTMWNDNLCTVETNVDSATEKFNALHDKYLDGVMSFIDEGDTTYDEVFCLSSHLNFRKIIMPSYKANRVGKRKPCGYYELKRRVEGEKNCITIPYLEADDVLGVLSGKDTVVVSGDKDMQTLPTRVYDFSRNTFVNNDKAMADENFFMQCLIGDKTDGYDGIPGVGKVTAEKILKKGGVNWNTVLAAYEEKGLTKNDALQQARVARILRHGEYKEKDGKGYIKLFGNSGFTALPKA